MIKLLTSFMSSTMCNKLHNFYTTSDRIDINVEAQTDKWQK